MFKKINNKGFTIVETLIVLAIAATIIIIVLLAVPALQRNSRNTIAKTAANDILSGWSTEVANANTTTTTGKGTAGTIAIGNNNYAIPNSVTPWIVSTLSTGANVTYSSTPTATNVAPGYVLVYTAGVCSSPSTVTTSQTVTQGSSTQVAVLYPVEGTTGQLTCLQG